MEPIKLDTVPTCPECGEEATKLHEMQSGYDSYTIKDGHAHQDQLMNDEPEGVVALCELGHEWPILGVTTVLEMARV